MKSAYLTLGVPGNASASDIEAAFQKAKELFPPQRLAEEDGALERFKLVKTAYDVLRDPDSRAAHDRKLSSETRPKPRQPMVVVEKEPGFPQRLLIWGVLLASLLVAGGLYVNRKNAEARKAQAELELADRQQAEREAIAARQDEERRERERVQAKLMAEAQDRRFTMDAQAASARAAAEQARQESRQLQTQRMEAAEAQRREAAARYQEERTAYEARMRVEAEKRHVRELCIQLYRRLDC